MSLIPTALAIAVILTLKWASHLFSSAVNNKKWMPMKSLIGIVIITMLLPVMLFIGAKQAINNLPVDSISDQMSLFGDTEDGIDMAPDDQDAWGIDDGDQIPSNDENDSTILDDVGSGEEEPNQGTRELGPTS